MGGVGGEEEGWNKTRMWYVQNSAHEGQMLGLRVEAWEDRGLQKKRKSWPWC